MKYITSGLVALALVSFAPLAAFAQQTQSLAISPLTFELTANPGEQVTNVLHITNTNDFPVATKIDVEDFTPSGEQGDVVVSQPGENQTYSLAHWISVDADTFAMAPHETHTLTFTINVPANAEPGGHYGTILASITNAQNGASGVGVASKVGALLLMQVAGNAKEAMSIASFTAPHFSEYGPVTITSRLQNTGSVHLKPFGFILVQNMWGHEVAKIPLDQKNVLPGSIRRIDTPFGGKWLFGKYTATLTAIYGSQNEPLSYVTSFWVIPWKALLAVVVGILVVLTLLFLMRKRIGLALAILVKGEHASRR